MKKLIIASALFLFSSICHSQNIVRDANGNYSQVKKEKQLPVKTVNTFTTTTGEVYPIYQSERGKLFIVRTSKKTGNEYKQYLKLD